MTSAIVPGTVIPGVAAARLDEWIKDNGIVLHPRLHIGASDLGGIGLVFDNADGEVNAEDDFEVLRIPAKMGLDYMSLLEVMDAMKLRDGDVEAEMVESQLVVEVLKLMLPKTETEIIMAYIVAFEILRQVNVNSDYWRDSPLRKLDVYLDVLTHTATPSYPQIKSSPDPFINKLIASANAVKLEYELFIGELAQEYKSLQVEKLMPFPKYYQIYQLIKLRSLEIPHASIDTDFSKLSLDLDSLKPNESDDTDFYINVTLVPILDFANHRHNNNAYFDVDLETSDVVLKLKNDSTIDPAKFEVTISYLPHELVQHFIQTYGFIPQLTDFQLFELKLPPMDQVVKDGTFKSKWMRILPQVQIVGREDEVYLNFFDNNLPLLFIDDFNYNPNWSDDAISDFRKYNDFADDDELDEVEILNVLKHQEECYDVINGVGPLGITFKGEKVDHLQLVIQAVARDDSGYSFDDLIRRTITFIRDHAKTQLAAPPLVDNNNNDDDDDGFTQLVSQYQAYQKRLLQRLVDYAGSIDDLILPEELAHPDWEANFRSLPRELVFGDE